MSPFSNYIKFEYTVSLTVLLQQTGLLFIQQNFAHIFKRVQSREGPLEKIMPARQFCSSDLLLQLLLADNYFTYVEFTG